MTKAYPNDLTWSQWELISHLFPEAKTGGRPRTTAMYGVMNAILYVLCQGCTWRALPRDFPAWSTVYRYFRSWRTDGTWLKVHDKLYQWVRVAALQEPSPSEAVVDSQSVETATMISLNVDYDAAKQIHGRKRHQKSGFVRSGFASFGYISQCSRASGRKARPQKSSSYGQPSQTLT